MKRTAWNCRGMGNLVAVCTLLDLQKQEDPDILFLSKTKLNKQKMEALRWKLGLTNMVCRPSEGKSGGLVLFWHRDVEVSLKSMSKYFIDVEVGSGNNIWRFTGIYGEPRGDRRDTTWKALRILRHNPGRWICMGDFNEILYQHEKQGGVPRPQVFMDKFREVLEDSGLDDLGYSGDTFTWRNNCHTTTGYIRERLDREVGNLEWRKKFLTYEVVNGDPRHSDHRPVTVTVEGTNENSPAMRGAIDFKFEANWLQEEGCSELIQSAWLNSFQIGESVKKD
jgi:exonuclease III